MHLHPLYLMAQHTNTPLHSKLMRTDENGCSVVLGHLTQKSDHLVHTLRSDSLTGNLEKQFLETSAGNLKTSETWPLYQQQQSNLNIYFFGQELFWPRTPSQYGGF